VFIGYTARKSFNIRPVQYLRRP
jgi:hypothetical protein